MGVDNQSDFTLRQMPKYYSKKDKSACFWNRFPLRLRWCYTGRFVTMIFNATQHYNIVATFFRMVAALFKTATLCCDENRRCKSSLCNITLIDPGHALQSLFRATENSSKGNKQVYNRASLIGPTSIAKERRRLVYERRKSIVRYRVQAKKMCFNTVWIRDWGLHLKLSVDHPLKYF